MVTSLLRVDAIVVAWPREIAVTMLPPAIAAESNKTERALRGVETSVGQGHSRSSVERTTG